MLLFNSKAVLSWWKLRCHLDFDTSSTS